MFLAMISENEKPFENYELFIFYEMNVSIFHDIREHSEVETNTAK